MPAPNTNDVDKAFPARCFARLVGKSRSMMKDVRFNTTNLSALCYDAHGTLIIGSIGEFKMANLKS